MRIIGKIALTLIALVVCVLIPLIARGYYYMGEGRLQEKFYFIIRTLPSHIIGDSPPFIVIAIYTYYLLRKKRSVKEIVAKLACLLVPVTIFSFYWYWKYLLSPLALGFLPFINLIILVPAWLVGLAITNAFSFTRNK